MFWNYKVAKSQQRHNLLTHMRLSRGVTGHDVAHRTFYKAVCTSISEATKHHPNRVFTVHAPVYDGRSCFRKGR